MATALCIRNRRSDLGLHLALIPHRSIITVVAATALARTQLFGHVFGKFDN
jgi:hypothetical protein